MFKLLIMYLYLLYLCDLLKREHSIACVHVYALTARAKKGGKQNLICVFSLIGGQYVAFFPKPRYRDTLVIKQHKGIQPERALRFSVPAAAVSFGERLATHLTCTSKKTSTCHTAFLIICLSFVVEW